MEEITARDLKDRLDRGDELEILDVREENEWDICHMDQAKLVPLSRITNSFDQVPKKGTVVVHCHHGKRSAMAIQQLEKEFPEAQFLNLKGGIHSWSQEIDPDMPQY